MRGEQRKACWLLWSSQMKLEWEDEADLRCIRDDTTRRKEELFTSKE